MGDARGGYHRCLDTGFTERSVVRGLCGGADDYLVKPARMSGLDARIEVVRPRAAAARSDAPRTVTTGDVEADLDARTTTVGGATVELTCKEFAILEVLLENPGAALSRQQLMDRMLDDAFVVVSRSLTSTPGLSARNSTLPV